MPTPLSRKVLKTESNWDATADTSLRENVNKSRQVGNTFSKSRKRVVTCSQTGDGPSACSLRLEIRVDDSITPFVEMFASTDGQCLSCDALYSILTERGFDVAAFAFFFGCACVAWFFIRRLAPIFGAARFLEGLRSFFTDRLPSSSNSL